MKWFVLALVLFASPAYAQVSVKTAAELSAALKDAKDGWIIEAEPGTVYNGAFVAPPLPTGARATLRVRGVLRDGRATPADAAHLATIRASEGTPLTVWGGWTVDGFIFEATGNTYGRVRIGSSDGYASAEDVPQHVELRRFVIDVPSGQQERRGVMVHGGHVTLRQCWIAGIKEADYGDTQAVAGWDLPGPVTIDDCRLEAAGEVIIFGGADPSVQGMTPTDLTITNNDVTRPMEWRGKWQVKNLLELKHARRVKVIGNRFSNNWASSQGGWFAVFTPANQNGRCPWCVVEDVTFENNVVTNVANGFNILGYEAKPGVTSLPTRGIVIRNNRYLIDGAGLGGDGRCYQFLDGRLSNVTIDHDTCIADGTFLNLDTYGRGKFQRVVVTNNLAKHNLYGVFGTAVGSGLPAFEAMLEAPTFLNNVLAGATQAGYVYPATTLSPTAATFASQFSPDWTLTPTSLFRNAGTDGKDLGALLTSVPVTVPVPVPVPPVTPPPPVPPAVDLQCIDDPLKLTVNRNNGWPSSELGSQLRCSVNRKARATFDPFVTPLARDGP